MNFIPKFIMPYEDELLYSWALRMADTNGFSINQFLSIYTNNNKRITSITYDLKNFFLSICQASRKPLDIETLFLKHSTFNVDKMAMLREQHIRYINAVFAPNFPLSTGIMSLVQEIKYCPECAKEDKEPYLHLSHNIAGVSVCRKHQCKLHKFKGIIGHELEFNTSNYDEIDDGVGLQTALSYASYASALNKFNFDCDIKKIKEIVLRKMNEMGYSRLLDKRYGRFTEEINNWEHRELFPADRLKFLKSITGAKPFGTPSELVPLLLYFFPDVNDFINKISNDKPTIQKYKCKSCGYEYFATPLSQKYGWGCPNCYKQMEPTNLIARIIRKVTHGEYVLVGHFTSASQKVSIHHKVCGKITQCNIRGFLFENKRCPCNNKLSDKDIENNVAKIDGFKLIKIKRQSSKIKIVVQHEQCETQRIRDYNSFIRNPSCNICHPRSANMDSVFFKQRVKSLVGDEYTVVRDFVDQKTKVVIRHNACGCEQEYLPRMFLSGQRCRLCHKVMTHKELVLLLEQYGKGRYSIIDHNKERYTIRDNKTQQILQLHRQIIRQEIMRPSPSNILPIDTPKEMFSVTGSWELGYQYLLKYIEEFGSNTVYKRSVYQGFNLGQWCQTQRDKYRENALIDSRVQKLRDIGFSFDPLNDEWDRRYNQYKRYVEKTGSPQISKRCIFENENLGAWIMTQKTRYSNNKLSQERINKLLILNPNLFGSINQRSLEHNTTGPMKDVVKEWRMKHPDGRKIDCQHDTGLSKSTVYKWWDA